MKLIAVLLTLACLQLHAKGYSQNEKVTFSGKDVTLQAVFSAINQQTGITFFVYDEQMKAAKKVSLNVRDESVENVLNTCLKDQPLEYKIAGKTVFIKEKQVQQKLPILGSPAPSAILKEVRGKIVNETGEAVEASIFIKGTTNGTGTNSKGEFSIKNVDADAVLIINGVMIDQFEVSVHGRSDLGTLSAQSKINEREAVVINGGYYQTTERLKTGNIAKVTATEIEKQPVTNPLQALQGRVPGLVVTQTNGITGSAFKIQIRGQNSLINGSDPLFVIDGVPFAPNNQKINNFGTKATTINNNTSNGGLSPFQLINPSDIESIEVLKDADATAIYGSRGSNGVILITTKKGRAGKGTLRINAYTGGSTVAKLPQMMNTQQYLALRREAFANDGVTPNATNAPDLLVWDTTRYTNWAKMTIGNTAHVADVNASISGGSSTTQYMISGGYHHETTVFPGQFRDKRASFSGAIKHTSNDKKFFINWSANGVVDNNVEPSSVSLGITLPPNAPAVYDSVGKLYWGPAGAQYGNPLANFLQTSTLQSTNILSNLIIGYQIMNGLTFKTSFGYNTIFTKEMLLSPLETVSPASAFYGTTTSYFGNNSFKSWIIEPQLDYSRNISKGKLQALVGGSLQDNRNSSSSLTASGYTNNALISSLGSAPAISNPSSAYSVYKYAAIFTRINYNWQDKYILNLAARRDGSSRFGPDRQYNNFGSVGAAWLFSNENFILNHFPILSYGKLRGSYGVTGNDQIGDYKYLPTWSSSGVGGGYGGSTALVPGGLFNPDYSWERNKKLEVGMELGFLSDRLLLSTSYFKNRCDNQLVNYTLASQTGFSSVLKNFPATVENYGWEFALSLDVIKKKNFKLNLGGNLTLPVNKLSSFPGIEKSSYANTYIVGKSVSLIKGYIFTGIDGNSGIYTFKDIDGNGTVSYPNDYVYLAKSDPKYYGGLSVSMTIKNIDLSAFFDFRNQTGKNYLYYTYFVNYPGTNKNQLALATDRWQKQGDVSALFEKATQTTASASYGAVSNFNSSSGALTDYSFCKLRNVSIGYNVPKNWLSIMKITGARVYFQGQNLLTFSKMKGGIDPEMPDYSSNIPALRTITLGVRLTF